MKRCFRCLQIGKCSVSELMNHLLSFHLPSYIRTSLKPCFWSPFPSSLPPDVPPTQTLSFLSWSHVPGSAMSSGRQAVAGSASRERCGGLLGLSFKAFPKCPALAFELSSIWRPSHQRSGRIHSRTSSQPFLLPQILILEGSAQVPASHSWKPLSGLRPPCHISAASLFPHPNSAPATLASLLFLKRAGHTLMLQIKGQPRPLQVPTQVGCPRGSTWPPDLKLPLTTQSSSSCPVFFP